MLLIFAIQNYELSFARILISKPVANTSQQRSYFPNKQRNIINILCARCCSVLKTSFFLILFREVQYNSFWRININHLQMKHLLLRIYISNTLINIRSYRLCCFFLQIYSNYFSSIRCKCFLTTSAEKIYFMHLVFTN